MMINLPQVNIKNCYDTCVSALVQFGCYQQDMNECEGLYLYLAKPELS